jgi:hypothetical protein
MKKSILALMFVVSLANAGVVKVATYPVRHPQKTTHGVGVGIAQTGKALGKSVAHVAKAVYNF